MLYTSKTHQFKLIICFNTVEVNLDSNWMWQRELTQRMWHSCDCCFHAFANMFFDRQSEDIRKEEVLP